MSTKVRAQIMYSCSPSQTLNLFYIYSRNAIKVIVEEKVWLVSHSSKVDFHKSYDARNDLCYLFCRLFACCRKPGAWLIHKPYPLGWVKKHSAATTHTGNGMAHAKEPLPRLPCRSTCSVNCDYRSAKTQHVLWWCIPNSWITLFYWGMMERAHICIMLV